MDVNTATQLSNEFKSKFSAVIPDIAQLIQQYQTSGALKTKIGILSNGCKYINGWPTCTGYDPEPMLQFVPGLLSFGKTSEPDPEIEQQFRTDIASKLFEPATFLNQSIQQTGESFEVHFFVDTATVNPEQPVVCQWVSDDVLQCSTL